MGVLVAVGSVMAGKGVTVTTASVTRAITGGVGSSRVCSRSICDMSRAIVTAKMLPTAKTRLTRQGVLVPLDSIN